MKKTLFLVTIVLVGFIVCGKAYAAEAPEPLVPMVSYPVKSDVSPPLSSMVPIELALPEGEQEIYEIPIGLLPKAQAAAEAGKKALGLDPVLQDFPGLPEMPSPILNFDGVNNVNAVYPPDTQGDVGPNHYVQWVNLSFAIYDKATGTRLYGPAAGNTIWTGFGGLCETHNDGDPITLYDHLADRWLMSQFVWNGTGPHYQCIAISQTGNPTGAWYRYAYQIPGNKFPDYPKFGVWPDGYYMTANQFNNTLTQWAGQGAFAFERDKMLIGAPAWMIFFDLYSVNPNYSGMLPSHLNGPVPPLGTPNYYVEMDDAASGFFPTDRLSIWEFHVDWATPANSTFGLSGFPNMVLGTAPFDSNLCGYVINCIPQPVTTVKVDAVSDRLMYRLQYRNFGSHQSMVVNHTVDVDGTDHAGIRWYELRDTGSGWGIYQQGTYAPDANHRWMGSIAMDSNGNMALGYSVSSISVYPSIRYTGRLAGNTLGLMTQGETTLIAGSGYQTAVDGRWGDYSTMSVDPVDGCTFWYTQEYYDSVETIPWKTRIGAFKFPSCTAPSGSVSINAEAAYTNTTSVTLTLSASEGSGGGVSQMRLSNDGSTWPGEWEPYGTSKVWTLSGGDGTKTVYVQYKDALGNSSGSYSDTIILDTVAPGGSVNINTGAAYTNTTSVTLTLFASDGSGSGISQMQFNNDGGSWSGWEIYATSKSWPLSVGDGTKTVYVQYKDVVGNVSNYTDTIVLDTTTPTDPTTVSSSSHSVGVWSSNKSVVMSWSGAADADSGVAGYSYEFSQSPSAVPDTTVDTTGATATSGSLADGNNWYFHIRTKDNAGNWTSTVHVGPYYIDGNPPTNPTSASETHGAPNNTWQNNVSDPAFTWSGASDGGSGVKGYYWYFGTDPSADPANWTTTAGCDPSAVSSGTNYVRVKTEDNAGNRSSAATLFTFKYDGTLPADPTTVASSSHTVSTWSSNKSVVMSWSGAADADSGVAGYSYEFSQSPTTVPDTTVDTTGTTATSGFLADGNNWYFHIRTKDNAGNWTSTVHVGPYYIDGTGPGNPIFTTETHGVEGDVWQSTVNDPAFTWTGASDSGSGVAGYYVYWGTDGAGTSSTFVTTAACDPPAVTEGRYYLRVKTKDNAGNEAASWVTLFAFKYDATIPTNPVSATETHGAANNTWQGGVSDPAFTWSGASDGGSGVKGYYWYFGTDPSGDPTNWTTTAGCGPAPISSGTYYLRVKTEDNGGNRSSPVTLFTVRYDGDAPTSGTISINSDAATTISLTVTLNSLGASDLTPLTQMMFSNNSSGPWSSAEPYAGTKAGWDLSLYGGSSAAGTKTVYVKYQDTAGNWSAAFSDTIYYQPMQVFPFMDDFSTEKGWYGYEAGGWERKPAHAGGGANGNPDPATDYTETSDNYILGYAIGADYTNGMGEERSVISPPVDCTGKDQVYLKFRRWLNVESRKASDRGDHARIYVSTDGVNWGDPVWENPGYDFMDDQWTQAVIDITGIAAEEPTVYIKFTMGPTNSTRPFSGWNIDDLEVTSESIYPVEGTIGTQISIPGAGFGMKKGKVLIGSAALKVLSWTDELIVGTVSKVMLPDVYDLAIQPKTGIPIPPYRDYFSVKRPEIDLIMPTSGSNPDQVTIKGRFFGSKKGKVYLEYDSKGVVKLKSCKVLSWNMDSKFSDGEVVFVVPKGLPPGTHPLKLVNSVGEALADFTILSP